MMNAVALTYWQQQAPGESQPSAERFRQRWEETLRFVEEYEHTALALASVLGVPAAGVEQRCEAMRSAVFDLEAASNERIFQAEERILEWLGGRLTATVDDVVW